MPETVLLCYKNNEERPHFSLLQENEECPHFSNLPPAPLP